MIAYIIEKKIDKNKNILILERIYFLNFVNYIKKKNILNKYFLSIKLISSPETKHKIFSLNFFSFFFYINNEIKKIENNQKLKEIFNIKIKNFFGAGTFIDEIFYKKYYKISNFYFVEHGIGNIVDFIFFNKLRKKVSYLLKIILNFFFFKRTTIYKGYIGLLNCKLPKDIYINGARIKKNITINHSTIKNILITFNKVFKIKFNLKSKKYNFILFNWNFLIKPTSKNLDKIFSNNHINYQKEVLIIKLHNKKMYQNDSNLKNLINIFKKKKIKFLLIKKNLSFLPAELIIYIYNVKKIISLMSSTVFYISLINPKVKSYLYFSYNKFFKKNFLQLAHSENMLYIYKKSYSNISFY
jgi:hypothetical protein